MKLVQVRECDGKCCEESPRWPEDNSCRFLENGKCQIQAGNAIVPLDPSPTWPDRHPLWVFNETCVEWPENMPERGTGGCCWQWVDGD